ncbi:uncharacterized protein SPPG_01815 [Spizellomyces punctatus DAOM BR117]|uniref:Uncharacterized protein n=1 Tax=Spizellomyces punctatus (strain DAOM BR117) TaxID=645134 RepID=A0A0L0HNR6_SPIPD|nr:uncharacterized protein SPPG_01815 [Spizellomyces punctatus DAOM BR117]KND02732.1 hypothetical protein SPPG_01815 [Spizellomyces punctatus DAOM BR117]|eukprot:XP_016610771.1 hypothetical protein SPPG_01815 [Spizellomyces punctatus DAOM BR117]
MLACHMLTHLTRPLRRILPSHTLFHFRSSYKYTLQSKLSMTTTSSTSLQETLETSSIDITHPPLDQSGLENVANFRDVGRNYNVDADGREESTALREGNLYRSARLDDATSEDVKVLQSRYNIKTVIDLRSDLERKECDHVASTFLFSAIEEEVQEELSPMHTHKSSCFQTQVLPEEFRNGKRTRYSIEFAGEDFRKYSVWKPLGVLTKL